MAMHTKYLTYPKDPDFMKNAPSIVEYQYWRIIDNKFPYDTIAKVHHMLVPKRQFAKRSDMTKKERLELDTIIDFYIEDYDMYLQNTEKAQSVPSWYHLHLLVIRVL
jgi:diadenosine tetraphosphate (Ap4A) HIT family hydrolase